MSYTKQNFYPGHKLTAANLNQMDTKIADQEENIDSIQTQINNYDENIVNSKIRNLRLETDSLNAYLYYGDIELSEIQLQSVPAGFVACTGLEYNGTTPIEMDTDSSYTVNVSKSPSNTSQSPVFLVSGTDGLSITNAGVLTGTKCCKGTVTSICGNKEITVPVNCSEVYHPDGELASLAYYSDTYSQLEVNAASSGNSHAYFGIDEDMLIGPGETLNVDILGKTSDNKPLTIMAFGMLFPGEGGFVISGTKVQNCTALLHSKSMGGSASGGNGTYQGSFNEGESAYLKNTTDAVGYGFVLIRRSDWETTALNIDLTKSAIKIYVSPEEEEDS